MFWGLVLSPCSGHSKEAYLLLRFTIIHLRDTVNVNIGRDRDWVGCIPIQRHVPIIGLGKYETRYHLDVK